jgi:hypothetical protein
MALGRSGTADPSTALLGRTPIVALERDAGPSTTFDTKSAPDFAENDTFVRARSCISLDADFFVNAVKPPAIGGLLHNQGFKGW